jgi:uncharacterized membrane protein YjgN (DUF898 family)
MNEGWRRYPFRFTGDGGEYFRIWIVNLALSVLALGIYSAWAKVRRKRYFSQHTLLDGHNFEYLGDPVAILKGRIVAFALLFIYVLAHQAMPLLVPVLALGFFAALPWIVVRTLRFNARNTRHRGLCFDFQGSLGEAARIFFGWSLLLLPTFGLILPYLLYRKSAFIAGNHVYGTVRSQFVGRAKSFYGVFLAAFVLMLAPLVLMVAGFVVFAGVERSAPLGREDLTALFGVLGLALVALYSFLPVLAGYLNARIARLTFTGTHLGELEFESRHIARALIWLYLSNLVLIVLTLSLFIPWARVRAARFWLHNLVLVGPNYSLGFFVVAAEGGSPGGAAGAEIAEAFDLDIALT